MFKVKVPSVKVPNIKAGYASLNERQRKNVILGLVALITVGILWLGRPKNMTFGAFVGVLAMITAQGALFCLAGAFALRIVMGNPLTGQPGLISKLRSRTHKATPPAVPTTEAVA